MIKGNNRQVEMIISDTMYLPFSATQLLVLILDQCSVTGKRGLEGAPDISDAAAQHSRWGDRRRSRHDAFQAENLSSGHGACIYTIMMHCIMCADLDMLPSLALYLHR